MHLWSVNQSLHTHNHTHIHLALCPLSLTGRRISVEWARRRECDCRVQTGHEPMVGDAWH